MSWTYGGYDWENPVFIKKRDELADLIPELDEYFDEVRQDDHEGSCWDLINGLAMLLTSKERAAQANYQKEEEMNTTKTLWLLFSMTDQERTRYLTNWANKQAQKPHE